MRIVLDTNVVVAGLLTPFGPCGQILRMVASAQITLLVDARILAEYEEVLARPRFGFDAGAVATLLDFVESSGESVASAPLSVRLPDPDDEPFLEVASVGHARALVTGNAVHFPDSACAGVPVVSPAAFIELFRTGSVG